MINIIFHTLMQIKYLTPQPNINLFLPTQNEYICAQSYKSLISSNQETEFATIYL